MTRRATAIAHPNIALVKYWGKRDAALNLPATGSFSLTLSGMKTTTTVEFLGATGSDEITLDERDARPDEAERITAFLDIVRKRAGIEEAARVETLNDFPTAAGLASSASGFAALTVAATRAAGLGLDDSEMSALARRGSGSAARSLFGGFVEMKRGYRDDGSDSHAVSVAAADSWDLRCLVAITQSGEKKIGSTEGMRHTAGTSPYYTAWTEGVSRDVEQAKTAVVERDFSTLARVAERSCLRMHASAMAADPGLLYWQAPTVELIHRIRAARNDGADVFFSIDAGPNVKAFCPAEQEARITQLLRATPGVERVIIAAPGPGAQIVE